MSWPAALDFHAHGARRRVGAGLGDPQAQPGCAEVCQQLGGQALGKGLHQLEPGGAGEGLHMLVHRGVVEGLAQVVSGSGRANVPGKRQVQAQALANAALPVVRPDQGVDFQTLDENLVQTSSPLHDKTQVPPLESGLTRPGMDTMFWLLALLAYLLGSLSFAILLSRLSGGPDPRASGSGNPGATNMLRVAGKKLAVLTLLGDLLKGLLPVLVAYLLGLGVQQQAWIGLAAVIGHLYPVYFRFQGGKGVATAAGMLLGLYPPAALLALASWALTFYLTRTSSLASLIATPLTLPLLAWQQPAALLPMCVLTGLIVWRHRGNLRDLMAGRERHF